MNIKKNENALWDFGYAVSKAQQWIGLGFADVQLKYRRSLLGPLWIVLSTGITIGLMVFLWSSIFDVEWRNYLIYITIGILIWQYISNFLVQSCELFTGEFGSTVRSQPIAPIFHVLRFCARNTIIFLHGFVLIALVFVISGTMPNAYGLLLSAAGLCVILLNGFAISVTFSFLCARMRDFNLLIGAVIGPMMLLTPVIWSSSMLGERSAIALFNPFTHFLEIVRSPLLGEHNDLVINWLVVFAITAFNISVSVWTYNRYRDKLVYWL